MLSSLKKAMILPFMDIRASKGFSLIELLLALGLLAMLALAFSKAFTNSMSSRKQISQKESYQQIDHILKKALVDIIVESKCRKVENFAEKITLMEGVSLQHLTKISSLQNPPSPTNAAALKRCEQPGKLQNNIYHFCLRLDVSATQNLQHLGLDSLLGAKNTFIEVLAEPFNFQRSSPATCQDLANNSAIHGLRILYSLYWDTTQKSGIQTHKKNGVFLSLPNI